MIEDSIEAVVEYPFDGVERLDFSLAQYAVENLDLIKQPGQVRNRLRVDIDAAKQEICTVARVGRTCDRVFGRAVIREYLLDTRRRRVRAHHQMALAVVDRRRRDDP